jgi:hypothetical protein
MNLTEKDIQQLQEFCISLKEYIIQRKQKDEINRLRRLQRKKMKEIVN